MANFSSAVNCPPAALGQTELARLVVPQLKRNRHPSTICTISAGHAFAANSSISWIWSDILLLHALFSIFYLLFSILCVLRASVVHILLYITVHVTGPQPPHLITSHKQLIQRPLILTPPILQYNNVVRPPQRRPPMRHDQAGRLVDR